jgi:hypothetical protein
MAASLAAIRLANHSANQYAPARTRRFLRKRPLTPAHFRRDDPLIDSTGYKIYDRHKDCGVHGLTDRDRRPYRQAHQPSLQI